MSTPTPNNGPYGEFDSAQPHQPGQPAQAGSPYAAAPGAPAPGGEQPGQTQAILSLVFGILGILLLPIVFGPLALWQAGAARKAGNVSGLQTAGRVLGWVGTILGVLTVVFVVLAVIVVIAGA